MGMFIRPVLDELIHYGLTNQEIIQKIDDNIIEIIPFFYMQGRSFINSIIIAEEVQNCTYDQILLLLTRFSRRSKLILTADVTQSYLPKNQRVDLDSLGEFLSNRIPDVGYIHMDDTNIVREVLVQDVLGCIDEWKDKN
jgi:phosphate starvation-inducible PhoH-like protein